MKILILDDEDIRHRGFDQLFPNDDLTHVKTVPEAIEALESQGPWDLVSLDHDLGTWEETEVFGKKYSVDISGYHAALYIAGMAPERRPAEVVIHSWNAPGATLMYEVLRAAGVKVSRQPYRPR